MATQVCGIGDAYLPASFNGVPFVAIEATSEHGRRGAEGEFPFGENTAYADLGRKIAVYTLRGRLQEDNHVEQAVALIAACSAPGPGVLVHPTLGILSAACRSCKITDNLEEEQGVTYADLEFVEANAWPNGLSVIVDTLIGFGVTSLITAAQSSFDSQYVMSSVPSARRPNVRNTMAATIIGIRDEYHSVIAGGNSLADFRALADLNNIIAEPVLLDDTRLANRALTLGMNAIAQKVTGQRQFDIFRKLANQNARISKLAPEMGGNVENTIFTTARLIAAAYMGQGSSEQAYGRNGEVFAVMDTTVDILRQEAVIVRQVCDNLLYAQIATFLINYQKYMFAKAYKLPALIEYNFERGIHPLAAAYSIFGDAKRHRELEQSNFIDWSMRFQPNVVGASR